MRTALAIIVMALLLSPAEAAKRRPHCISSITGKFVSLAYAKAHPDVTVCRNRVRV